MFLKTDFSFIRQERKTKQEDGTGRSRARNSWNLKNCIKKLLNIISIYFKGFCKERLRSASE